MSVEFSDSDTLLNYTGIVKTWSAGGQVCLCGGGGEGSGCQRFEVQRERMLQSTCGRVRSFSWGGGDAPECPALKLSIPDSLLGPAGTFHNILARFLKDGGPNLAPAGGLWLSGPVWLCSPLPGWDFISPLAVMGLLSGGRFLGLDNHYSFTSYHQWVAQFSQHYMFCFLDWIHLLSNHFLSNASVL